MCTTFAILFFQNVRDLHIDQVYVTKDKIYLMNNTSLIVDLQKQYFLLLDIDTCA